MISAIIIEDDRLFAKELRNKLMLIAKNLGWNLRIDILDNPYHLLYVNKVYDIYFIDILISDDMKITGIDLAVFLRNAFHINSEIIFVSEAESYIRNTLKVKPIAFIRKNYLDEDIEETLKLLYLKFEKENQRINVFDNKKKVNLDLAKIVYIKSNEHYIHIYLEGDKDLLLRNKLNVIEEQLEKYNFLRIHVRYIVNLEYVKSYYNKEIILKNGDKLPVSKSYQKKVETVVYNWLNKIDFL